MNLDLIIKNAGQLITCASAKPKRRDAMQDIGSIENGAVAILDGKIAGVGTSEDILREYSATEISDADGRVVCPAFVDPHTHIVYAGDRLNEFELKIKGADYLEILAKGGGILSTVQKTRNASVDSLVQNSLARLDKMLACGTTTVEIKTGYGLDLDSELKMLSVMERIDSLHPIQVVPTLLAAHAVPPEHKKDADGYVALICETILPAAWRWFETSHFCKEGIPFFVDVFCERNAFDLDQSRLMIEKAAEFGFRVKAHVDEFTNLGGSRLAISLGATSIDHLDSISDEEIQLLKNSKTIGVVTPTVNFNFGSAEFANARKLIDSGCAVALSSDYNPGSAPCASQPMVMAIACRYQKLSPAEALNAATINAAFAAGIGSLSGSIETGKRADISIYDVDDFRELCYEFGTVPTHSVYQSGKLVFERNC